MCDRQVYLACRTSQPVYGMCDGKSSNKEEHESHAPLQNPFACYCYNLDADQHAHQGARPNDDGRSDRKTSATSEMAATVDRVAISTARLAPITLRSYWYLLLDSPHQQHFDNDKKATNTSMYIDHPRSQSNPSPSITLHLWKRLANQPSASMSSAFVLLCGTSARYCCGIAARYCPCAPLLQVAPPPPVMSLPLHG